jgi:hypothetical protein
VVARSVFPIVRALRTAVSAPDTWATGSDGAGLPMLANWRGSGWTVTPAPSARGTGVPLLVGIAALAPGSVWAVGWVWDGTTGRGNPLAARTTNG